VANEWLSTPVWLLKGMTGSTPGVLRMADKRVALTTEDGPAFDVALTEIQETRFPWYYFGGGAKLRVGNKEFRLSFVRPNGAQDIPARLMAQAGVGLGGLETVVGKALDIRDGRRVGKAWKAVLSSGTTS